MRTRAPIGLALGLALGGAAAVGSAPALAIPAVVQCGQVVTSSVVVTNDLSECLEHGLVVGADGIIIDLGGHTLDGVGLGAGVLNAGFDDVTITNGTLSGFDFGVLLTAGAGNNIVTGVMPTLNAEAAIQLSGAAPGNEISGNRFGDNGLAVGIAEGSEAAVVRSNVVEASSGHGIHVLGSHGNRIEDNDLTGAADGGIVLHGASGNVVAGNVLSGVADGAITLDLESNNNLIEANAVTDSEGGVLIDSSFGNQVIGNTVHGMSDDAVDLEEAHRTVVLGNDLRFNAGGVELLDSTDNRVEGNLTSESAGTGIALEGVAHRNAIVKNVSNDNDSFGITVIGVTPPEDGNRLYRNETNRNGGGGINVSVAGHTLRANDARGNGGWGIYAGTGTTDGGFNTASGNSESSQCFGVVCLRGGEPPIDSDPPDTTITDAPRAVTVLPSATFEFASVGDEFGARFECSLDGEEFVGCAAPQRFTGLPHGEHTFAVRAIDLDGNVDPTPATHQWAFESIPTVDCGPPVTVHADADSWIDQNSATSNKGSDSALKVRSKGPNDNFRTLVRFPLPTLTDGCEVDAATLRMYADGPALGRTLEAVRLATPWAEETVTWQTQPRTVGPPAFVPSGEGFRSWSVKPQVQAMYDEEAAHGFLVKDAEEGADAEHGFNPREDEFAPELVIRYSPVFEAPPDDTTPPDTTIDSGPDPLVFSSTEAGSTFDCALDGDSIDDCTSPFALPDLEVGPHTFAVAATDPAGNRDPSPAEFTWTVAPPPDTSPPQTSIDEGPEETTTETAATLVFSADEDASFVCALDDEKAAPCASPVTYADLAVGEHTFSVVATDLAGNAGEAVIRSWTIVPPPDTSPPDTSIDAAPPATTTEQSATFNFSASEEGSTFECALDDGDFAACAAPVDVFELSVGAHTFAVRAIDAAGNVDPVPAAAQWTVLAPPDTTAPDTLIDDGPPSITMNTSATFVFSSDDVAATFECALDDGPFAGCTTPHDLAGVAVGAHTFWVRASDPAGNVDDTPASYPWTVEPAPPPPPGDEAAPRTTITAGPDATTSETAATFMFIADDPTATFACALDDGAFSPCSSPTTYSGLAIGAHTFLVRATDPAGNVEDPPTTTTWEVVEPPDRTAPTVTILDGPSTTTSATTASFSFVVDEPASTECALDIAAFAPCTSPSEHNDLALGTHTFAVRATDQAGNQSATSFVWTVVAPPDTTPPVVAIISGPPSPTSAASATFEFTANEPATIRCALDDGAFATCGSPLTYPSLALGQHTFQVRATDAAGNVGAASWGWTIVDITAPNTMITSGPASPTTATSATFTFTANEVGARFECRLDSTAESAFAPCTSPRTYTALSVGAHTFAVRAIDPSGNVDASAASFGWTIQLPPDTTPPQTTITSGPPAQTLSTSAEFVFEANEPSSTFQCRLDGGAWLACTSRRTYVNVPVGSHLFEVRATDLAGNLDTTPAPHPWTVQSPPPPPPPGPTCSIATLTAGADAWIDQNSAMTNRGDDSILKVRSKGPADNFRALVRFDRLPPAPAGCVIGSATLRLHSGSSGEGRSLVAQRTSAAWAENGVTWSNQPTAEGPTATTAIVADVDDLEWNVQPHVNAAHSAGTVSFVIRDAVEGDDAEQQFHSREKGESPPQLVISFVQPTS